MDRRLNKPLVLAMVAVALLLGLLLGIATGVADRILGGPNPTTIASASLESMRAQNRLTVFAARYVSVVTSAQQRLGGLVSSERTLILPGDVRYELDLSKLQQGDVAWDGAGHTLTVLRREQGRVASMLPGNLRPARPPKRRKPRSPRAADERRCG